MRWPIESRRILSGNGHRDVWSRNPSGVASTCPEPYRRSEVAGENPEAGLRLPDDALRQAQGKGIYNPQTYKVGIPPALPRLVYELFEVIRLGAGATLERVDQPPRADQPAIVIGDCEETRKAGIDAAKIPVEGFVVKTAPIRYQKS